MKTPILPILLTSLAILSPFSHGQETKLIQQNKSILPLSFAPNKTKQNAELKQYFISKTSPRPTKTSAIKTTLPLNIKSGANVAFIGNLLLDNERRHGDLETLIHQKFPKHKLHFKNFAWPADEPGLMPRPSKFGDLEQHLTYFKSDVIIAAFGYSESFAGKNGLDAFKLRLSKFLAHTKTRAYNGKSAPQIILLSPTANENIKEVSAADSNNSNIKLYTEAMAEIAKQQGIAFVDVFTPTLTEFSKPDSQHTTNGHALRANGHTVFAKATYKALFSEPAPTHNKAVQKLVLDKAFNFEQRYRPLNTYYYTGGRRSSYGYLDFLPAMRNFDIMVANRDKAIHATLAGKPTQPDDSNLPKLESVAQGRGANKWMSPADEKKAFTIDPRFEVTCFASEEDFPELACPIAIRWDAKGRLWVSCSTAYPHLYPGGKAQDKLIILEDTDNDGKADKCTTFADDLHIPLSFELDGKGGVYVSEQPHVTYLQDTDGDGKADSKEIIYTGFGVEDSHHSIHDFVWTPAGDLLFRESVFHHSQVETPYGAVRARDSAWFLYHPSTKKLTAFGSYFNTNPWGVTYDSWGNHVASHPVFASSFHALNPKYPKTHIRANKSIQAYSGVCGHDFVNAANWPKDMQGGFVKVRYKPTNRVEFHTWTKKDDHFAEKHVFNIIFSKNLSFIPVDCKFGPDGACYICDWYNPVKGHMQYALRDPRRDRKSGRIWRILPKGAKAIKPNLTDGKSIDELVTMLSAPEYRTRYRAKRALRSLDKKEVISALDKWISKADTTPKAQIEALWVKQSFDALDLALLEKLIRGNDELIAASAYGTLRFWASELSAEKVNSLLSYGASHDSQHVRRETVICASYVATEDAYKAILPILDQPAGPHLAYAALTSFHSEAIAKHWQDAASKNAINQKLRNMTKNKPQPKQLLSKEDKAFDAQKDLQVVKITCVAERLQFDKAQFKVKAGKPVKLTLDNPDATAHNLVILTKGADIEKVGTAANNMARTPAGEKKHFIPESERKLILHHTKLLKEHQQQTLRFTAPKKPGKYPYVCTFPGHWTVMKGVMIVE